MKRLLNGIAAGTSALAVFVGGFGNAADTSERERVMLQVINCDNRLKVVINDASVYDATHHGDQQLCDEVDITEKMQAYVNKITVLGVNVATDDARARNPWHFRYRIVRGDKVLVDVDESGPHQNINSRSSLKVLDKQHDVVLP